MKKPVPELTILLADDDQEDCFLLKEAFERAGLPSVLRFVHDGEELMEYLSARGAYAGSNSPARPDLILLDLNMPKKDGRQALKELKSDPALRAIPIVVLTTSQAEDDIRASYDAGANSYMTKPVTFQALVTLVTTLSQYWCTAVELPPEPAVPQAESSSPARSATW